MVSEKLFSKRWLANITMNYGLSSGGAAGYWSYYEDASRVNLPHSYDERKVTWISSTILKAAMNYITPETWVKGILGDITVGVFYEYFSGPEYTYYAPDYTGLRKPNNKRWYPHQRTDLKLSKRVPISTFNSVISLEVYNLFNNYDRMMLGGENLINWEEDGKKPVYWQSGESNTWWFYNSISNPKRMVYLSFSLEF